MTSAELCSRAGSASALILVFGGSSRRTSRFLLDTVSNQFKLFWEDWETFRWVGLTNDAIVKTRVHPTTPHPNFLLHHFPFANQRWQPAPPSC